jgi:hypothetical protein
MLLHVGLNLVVEIFHDALERFGERLVGSRLRHKWLATERGRLLAPGPEWDFWVEMNGFDLPASR